MKCMNKEILTKTLLTLLLCFNTASASAPSDRQMTPEEIMQIEEDRIALAPKEILESSHLNPKASVYSDDEYYLDRIHKLAYIFPQNVINAGQKIELCDQSRWFVNSVQRYVVCNWVQTDTIFIKPKSSCFSMYPYVLYNRTTLEAVEVQFCDIPKYYGAFRQRIAKIDYYSRTVQLDDPENTVWQISFGDYAFNQWQIGDFIIVGVNNDWRIANFPHIMINASIPGAPYSESEFFGYGINL